MEDNFSLRALRSFIADDVDKFVKTTAPQDPVGVLKTLGHAVIYAEPGKKLAHQLARNILAVAPRLDKLAPRETISALGKGILRASGDIAEPMAVAVLAASSATFSAYPSETVEALGNSLACISDHTTIGNIAYATAQIVKTCPDVDPLVAYNALSNAKVQTDVAGLEEVAEEVTKQLKILTKKYYRNNPQFQSYCKEAEPTPQSDARALRVIAEYRPVNRGR